MVGLGSVGSVLWQAWRAGDLRQVLFVVLAGLVQVLLLVSPALAVVLLALFAGGGLPGRGRARRRWRGRGGPAALPEPAPEALDPDDLEMLAPSPGEFTPDCPVCGVPLAGPVMRCPRCEAPHHPDCWAYHGGCATYGCRPS